MSHLTEYETDQLLTHGAVQAEYREHLYRLVDELRELREQAGERERIHAEEVTW